MGFKKKLAAQMAQQAMNAGFRPPQQNQQQHNQQQQTSHFGGFTSMASAFPGARPNNNAGSNSNGPPSLSNLGLWFDYFDRDRGGSLDKEEVVNGLVQTLTRYHSKGRGGAPIDIPGTRSSVYNIWPAFDLDGSGKIDKREFTTPGGLGESLQAMSMEMGKNNHSNNHTNTMAYANTTPQPPPASSAYNPYAASAPPPHHHNMPQAVSGQPYVQQQQQSKTVRIGIPAGMQPGQMLQIPSPSGQGETLKATVPDMSRWIQLPSGQPAFDHTFMVPAPPVVMAQATVVNPGNYPGHPNNNNHPAAYNPNAGYTQNNMQAPPDAHSYAEPFQPYEYAINAMAGGYRPPPLGMRQVPVSNPGNNLIPLSGRRRALLIGINYKGTSAALAGCINDAKNMKGILQRNGYPDDGEHMVVLTDDRSSPRDYQPTRANIMKALQWLTQGVSRGDTLFLHFSGHGSQEVDKTGHESDGLNETICPSDYKRGQITDDELWGSVVYPLPEGVRLTALMDCCHSGTGLDLPYEYKLPGSSSGGYKQKNKHKNKYGNDYHQQQQYSQHHQPWKMEVNPAHSQGDVVLFSGCEDDQTSADVGGGGGYLSKYQAGGAMTQSFIRAYETNPMATYTDFLKAIHTSLKQRKFTQRPQLTASQQFDVNQRIFSFQEGNIQGNGNTQVGRVKTKNFKPKNKYQNNGMNKILGLDMGDAVALGIGAMVLGSIFD